ncbi:hypothetical protein [Cohnella cholangitidis]|uniref:Lipoprotein n=1 Tax=Cohnella cholangitidis TaxID=2598458 RepID=A0A7G5BSV3_9BACL|nr:hypothetical protein [Cohnella cholangitidis]QMV40037.1 hypothetical protein FPL14_01595 [Cohnella cholangitidis]
MRNNSMVFVMIMALLTACANVTDEKNQGVPGTIESPTASVMPSPKSTEVKRSDNSVRAIGTHPNGRLLIQPAGNVIVAPLGAPSCYGLETDLSWSGDYEAVWESETAGTISEVMAFPSDFEIIQPNDVPVEMQKFSMGDTDVFAFVPRYTDCHGLDTYLFGVTDGKAFHITFEMKSGEVWLNIDQHPHKLIRSTKDELIVTGGYGAGQDTIDEFHFKYDSSKHSMILQKTNQLKPDDKG